MLGYKMAGPGNVIHNVLNPPADLNVRSDWILTAPGRDWTDRTGKVCADCGAVAIGAGQPRIVGSKNFEDIPLLPEPGAIIYGANAGDRLGTYLAPAGDVDRDGFQDFLVSSPGYSDIVLGRTHCGAVYLIYGGPHLQGEFDIVDIGTPACPARCTSARMPMCPSARCPRQAIPTSTTTTTSSSASPRRRWEAWPRPVAYGWFTAVAATRSDNGIQGGPRRSSASRSRPRSSGTA
ncbi:MAG: integrin alpha [Myxococcales bacterium]